MLDRERLAKVLALTASSQTSEALAAMRKANEIVTGAGLTWGQVLASGNRVTVTVMRNELRPEAYEPEEPWVK
jgi:hypothetical protein